MLGERDRRDLVSAAYWFQQNVANIIAAGVTGPEAEWLIARVGDSHQGILAVGPFAFGWHVSIMKLVDGFQMEVSLSVRPRRVAWRVQEPDLGTLDGRMGLRVEDSPGDFCRPLCGVRPDTTYEQDHG